MKRSILVLFLLLSEFCTGQDLIFNHLMTENGLSQNSIFAIAQDSRGFMWYGSRYGLNRYDGSKFHLYRSNAADTSSLSDDYISALYNDARGVLWAGTINGLNKFNPRKNNFERIRLNADENKTPVYIRTINEDRKGHLWVGTNNGLYMQSADQSQFIPADQLGLETEIAKSEVLSIYEDHEGYLWIGTDKRLVKSLFSKKFSAIKIFTRNSSPTSISDNSVTAITEDRQKNLWLATENGGINLFNRTTQNFTRFLHKEGNSNTLVHNAVRKIIISKTGELWIGTLEGLSILNPVTGKFSTFQHHKSNPKSLNQNSVYSIYEDLNGSVWVGTYYGGVNVVYASPTKFKTWQYNEKLTSLNHNVVSSITEDKDNRLWIGTEGGGLNYYQPHTRKFGAYTFMPHDPASIGSDLVKVVYRDKTDRIWIGTHGGGLNLFDPLTGKFKRFFSNNDDIKATRSEIVALLEDHQARFWVGSQTGLGIFSKSNTTLTPYPIPEKLKIFEDKNIKVLFEDSRQNIWIAAISGLYTYFSSTNSLQLLALPTGANRPITNTINCICEDSEGNIWMGLYYGGLAKYNPKKRSFTHVYTTKDGLSNDNVLGIIEDNKHHLWISTSNGLSKLDPLNSFFQTYTTSDGLSGDDFNYNSFFKNKAGAIFFGGFNGLTYFFPDEIQKNNFRAPIVFTGLLLFNKPVDIGAPDKLLAQDISFTKELLFKYDQNVFTIQFALLNYIKSKKNKYAYKLEGVNQQWIETNTASAAYTNLPSGTYTLLVKGANNDGVWSKPASIEIEILPPFWKTWWAFCIYLIIVVVIIFLIIRFFYLRELLIKDEELHQIKLNFFTNVSHEIRTHLTLIMAPIEKLLDGNQNNSSISWQLNNVKNNADRLLKLTSELMDFRKAETNNLKLHVEAHNLVTFLHEIGRSFEELSEKKKIHFSIVYDHDPVTIYFDKEQLEKVFFNLISNAFKFTPAGGSITINIKLLENQVTINVEDTGRGIAPEYLDRLFTNFFQVDDHSIQNTGYGIGLALSKHIVELHQGTISVTSSAAAAQQAGYTSFTVRLLTGTAHFSHTPYLQHRAVTLAATTEEKEAGQEQAPITEVARSGAENNVKKHTILVIEDNAELRLLIKESLLSDYHVLTAKNGLQGWEKAIEEIPDLIVSDVMMPGMDGFMLCHQLKSDVRTSHIPVILLTAKSSEADQISGLKGGADMYLTKPFSNKIFLLNLHNLLTGRETMRQKFSKLFVLEPQQILIDDVEEQFLSKLIRIIENNMEDENFGVELLAGEIGMSQSVLYKKLKALTNMSVNDFSKSIRLKRAAQLLMQKKYTIYEIGYMIGFSDRKYFSREFKKQFGKTPSDYLKI
ncbi:MAG TPA: two-component regulator propeller domain-containing protein [Pedobacter sp.]|uniref:hybrid sensor histidine kinase/response regulator transcription factor n=1 Tax=Pedobacter sp. TaxID=1411316 RepID=UPI002B937D06|nr:two-component regulator propeller domain-containing protein [Pedobacter sp.]HMI01703.1 two-component regulator propeller domain-containing protein [Pedobacter sp.]